MEEDLAYLNKRYVHCGSPIFLLETLSFYSTPPAPNPLVQRSSLLILLSQGNCFVINKERGIYISLLQVLYVT